MSIEQNWREVCETVARHARGAVTVVAVTKGRSEEEIRQVVAAGAMVVGENRIEETTRKFGPGGGCAGMAGVAVHMIGHLQSRKAREAVALFDCIQSVDTEKLAREIDARCAQAGRERVDVLIEVNVSGEEQKSGVRPADAEALARAMIGMPRLRLKGLMTMAPYVEDENILRPVFCGLRVLGEELGRSFGPDKFAVLSMGMSHDYRVACEEGSTMVRIGTALFPPIAR